MTESERGECTEGRLKIEAAKRRRRRKSRRHRNRDAVYEGSAAFYFTDRKCKRETTLAGGKKEREKFNGGLKMI